MTLSGPIGVLLIGFHLVFESSLRFFFYPNNLSKSTPKKPIKGQSE
jgi:hypothetical protein